MKVVILCGGLGTRLSEETVLKPKPMVEIGQIPILQHIMNSYAQNGFDEFLIALGYKGYVIKDYFLHYFYRQHDFTMYTKDGSIEPHRREQDDWKVHLIDTGMHTMTGGRLLRLKDWLNHETFMLTYGDGVSDVNIEALLAFHKSHGKIATVTAVRPKGRFGVMDIRESHVSRFKEKLQTDESWINGGYFVFEPAIFDYLVDDGSYLERDALEALAEHGELMAYKHDGFWQCMDTLRDKRHLEAIWETGNAPWVGENNHEIQVQKGEQVC